MNRRNRRRQLPTRPRARPVSNPMSRFVPCANDPPSGVIQTWKDIRLSFEIQPGSVSSITTTLVNTEMIAIGIPATAIRILKISAWAMPGAAANQTRPVVNLAVQDPITAASIGQRRDSGLLSRAAKLAFTYAGSQREHALQLSTPRTLCEVEITGSPAGTMILSLSYLI
jgi:hypothetical protein